uniref:Uncharacterized protein n=1 Tax=Lygus hesperus TaxID=30085 RepID=A0A0A9WT67_LYGHE
MNCFRYLMLIVTLISFIILLIAIASQPVYSIAVDKYNQKFNVKMGLFEVNVNDITLVNDSKKLNFAAYKPVRINLYQCKSFKAAMRALEAFNIAGVVFSFFGFMVALLLSFCKKKVKLPLMLFCVFGFAT